MTIDKKSLRLAAEQSETGLLSMTNHGVISLLDEIEQLTERYESLRATAVRCHPNITETCECRVAGIMEGWGEYDRFSGEVERLKAELEVARGAERERWGNARKALGLKGGD